MLTHLLAATLGLLAPAQTSAPAAQPEPAKTAPAPAPGPCRVIQAYSLGGEGSWDYLAVDPEARRLYIPRSTHVMVMDTESGKIVGDIAGTSGVHGVALVPALHKGFTSNGRDGTVTVFDTETLKTLGSAKAGGNPDAITYEPVTKHVWVFNGKSKDATVIDPETLSIVDTVALGGKPEFAAMDGKGHLFVNIEDTSELLCLDAATRKVEHRWPLAPGSEPSGLAIDPEHHRLFSVCANQKMIVVDSESGAVLASPAIGKGVDGAAFDAGGGFALSSNGDGTVSVVGTTGDKPFQVVQTLTTAPRARTIVIDPKTRRAYLPTAEFEAPKEGATGRPAMKAGTFKIIVVGF